MTLITICTSEPVNIMLVNVLTELVGNDTSEKQLLLKMFLKVFYKWFHEMLDIFS